MPPSHMAVVPAAGNGAANWGCLPPRLAPPGPPGLYYVTQHWWVLCCRGGCIEFVVTCKWVLHHKRWVGTAAFASVSNLTFSSIRRVADCIRRQQRQDESAYRPAAAQAPAQPPPKPPAGAVVGNGVGATRAGAMRAGEEGEALPAVEAIKAWLGPLWRPECAEMGLAELALQIGAQASWCVALIGGMVCKCCGGCCCKPGGLQRNTNMLCTVLGCAQLHPAACRQSLAN